VKLGVAGALLVGLTCAASARATGFTDIGQDLRPRDKTEVHIEGYFRVRSELLENLDLDRGLTPSGTPIYPVPIDDPRGQTLTHADTRLRTDLAIYSLGGNVAVKSRIDVLDDLAWGSGAVGIPAASSTVRPPSGAFRVKRVYGEVRTPIGVLAVGRMGAHWGLGMLVNGGDCPDCDSGDAQDRIAFMTPLAGHIFALSYDLSAVGPLGARQDGIRTIGLAPSTDVRTVTFAMLRWDEPFAHDRRLAASKTTVNYGAFASYRWQKNDAPLEYLPVAASPVAPQIMVRGYRATAFDAWVRVVSPWVRVEAEGALILGSVDQPSLVPGVLYNTSVTSRQIGAALTSDIGRIQDAFGVGFDVGYASGDAAPGFGAVDTVGAPLPKPGDLQGSQANPPNDTHVDNFRFHPDYRIDRILFREIIGTVTDAYYLRPHARLHLLEFASSTITASVAGIASWAVYASSTPGGKTPLGLEIDPTLSYVSRDGFSAALEYAVLFPFSGFDNPAAHLTARTAQLLRLRLLLSF
jgi:uncharacterized protein (TIGR04551 family)